MGLDIYHMRAREDMHGVPCVVAPDTPALRRLSAFFRSKENDYIDWDWMFAFRGLAAADYALRSRSLSVSGRREEYGFVRAAEAGDPHAPLRVVFGRADAVLGGIRTAFGRLMGRDPPRYYGPFSMRRQVDTVIYAENIGYQRGSVVDRFFDEFPPDDVVTDAAIIHRIHELTSPEARATFQQDFIDNWDAGRSFVIISW